MNELQKKTPEGIKKDWFVVEFLCFCFPFCLPVHFTPIRLFGNVKQQRHLAFFFHIFLNKAWCHFGTYQNCKKRKVELPIRICIDMVEIFLKSPNVQPKVEVCYVIYWVVYKSSLVHSTDYGRSMNLFFIEIQTFWVWTDKLAR